MPRIEAYKICKKLLFLRKYKHIIFIKHKQRRNKFDIFPQLSVYQQYKNTKFTMNQITQKGHVCFCIEISNNVFYFFLCFTKKKPP